MRYISFILLTTTLAATAFTPAMAKVPTVVTDFGPTHALVSKVMGDLGAPVMLLPKGADPHDFQMKPSQARSLADADLIFWTAPELMPALGDAIIALGNGTSSVPLLQEGGGNIRTYPIDGSVDPHGWLDPDNAVAWLGKIATELAAKDPDNAATYATNAAMAQDQIRALDAELGAALAPVRSKPFVVFHDALGYFADHYGLNVAGAIELGDATSPSAAQLSDIRRVLDQTKAVCVFPEAGRDPKYVSTVSEGTSARIGQPQDVEAITLDPGPDLYAALLRALTAGLTDCLSKG
jgi:zinc transport system substrate-binding protein